VLGIRTGNEKTNNCKITKADMLCDEVETLGQLDSRFACIKHSVMKHHV